MKILIAMSFLIFGSAQFSFAAEVPTTPAPSFEKANAHLIEACKADVEKFCKGIQMGGGRIIECLKEHKEHLSPECKSAGEVKREEMKDTLKKKRAEIREACESDFDSLCKGIHGPRNRLNCLKKNEAKLSASCKESLPK